MRFSSCKVAPEPLRTARSDLMRCQCSVSFTRPFHKHKKHGDFPRSVSERRELVSCHNHGWHGSGTFWSEKALDGCCARWIYTTSPEIATSMPDMRILPRLPSLNERPRARYLRYLTRVVKMRHTYTHCFSLLTYLLNYCLLPWLSKQSMHVVMQLYY